MSKKEKQQGKSQASTKSALSNVGIKSDLFEKTDVWFEKHNKKVFYFMLVLSTLFSYILFDAKVSDGGDDSSYIERAWSLLYENKFPYFQGPGYPIFLSIVVKMFGLNVIALKMFSVFCHFGFVWFTYKAFVKRIPYTVLFALISFISVNSFIQYYSSQTFTETFFLFIQSISFYIFFKIIDSIKTEQNLLSSFKENYWKWILFGLLFVLLSISKSVAVVAIVAVVVYFVFNKNYKQIVIALASFIIIRLIYTYITTSMYGASTSDQFEMILRKQLYKPELGYENFGGMFNRFFDNCNTYFSLHVYRILHLRPDKYDITSFVPFFAFLTSMYILVCTLLSFKKNRFMFFTSIYLVTLCGGIFFGIQAQNMQDRLIIIVMPFIFLLLFYWMYMLAKRYTWMQTFFILFVSGMLVWNIYCSLNKVKENAKTSAYTPDWQNFLEMSKYCADSLPDSAQVLSRKPSMSFLYSGGKKFIGQFVTTSMNADTVLMSWQKQKVQYVILGNLRMNPAKNNGRVINTIHRMIGPVYKAYPQKIRLVKSIGTKEKCELYEIVY